MNHRRVGAAPARLPNRLWQYRKRMGFTQQEVATMLGYLCARRPIVITKIGAS